MKRGFQLHKRVMNHKLTTAAFNQRLGLVIVQAAVSGAEDAH